MKSEFALAFNEILEDKGLPREVIMGAINSAMVSAYRKSVGASAAQEVRVDIDLDKGSVGVYAEKEVTDRSMISGLRFCWTMPEKSTQIASLAIW